MDESPELALAADVLVYDTETDTCEQIGQSALAAAGVELLRPADVHVGKSPTGV